MDKKILAELEALRGVEAESLERWFPAIPWREPLRVTLLDGSASGYACRFCVVQLGLNAEDISSLPKNPEAVLQHIEQEHPLLLH